MTEPVNPVQDTDLKGAAIAARPPQAEVVINVRFRPDGGVDQINERPAAIAPQEWFNRLVAAGHSFEALAGGRGAFRLDVQALQALHGRA